MIGAAVLFTLLLVARPAEAGLTAAQLAAIDALPPAGATLPLSARLIDEAGVARPLAAVIDAKPAILILADYSCRTLCGPVLAMTTAALDATGLTPGRDFRLIVIGLDPKDSAADAQRFKAAQMSDAPGIAAATTMLRADPPTIDQLTHAAGYRFVYDAANDQFAHPNVVFALTANGRVARVLSGLGLNGSDLRLALVDAGEGRIGSFADHVRLLCYGFDPVQGIYTARIMAWLQAAGVLTVLILVAGVAAMHRRTRRRVS